MLKCPYSDQEMNDQESGNRHTLPHLYPAVKHTKHIIPLVSLTLSSQKLYKTQVFTNFLIGWEQMPTKEYLL